MREEMKKLTYPVPPVASIVTVAFTVEVFHDEDWCDQEYEICSIPT